MNERDLYPAQMNVVGMAAAGAPDVLQIESAPLPVPTDDEVLIRVLAAGVNRPDVAQRQGHYPPPSGASPVLGLEVAGEVVLAGRNVGGLRPGDRVCALTNGGGYAEYAVAPESQCLPWPEGYDAAQAAALPEVLFTVWANLFGHGRLKAGESVLVHGGASGIGVAATQLAKARGATVYVTAGSDEKCAACGRIGADRAINYREKDFEAAVNELTRGVGVDVVLDMVGATYLPRNLRVLKMDGRLVLIAFLEGWIAQEVDLSRFMTHRLTLTGSMMRPRTRVEKAAIAADLRREIWPILDRGVCAPVIDQVFPLTEVAAAHAHMETSAHVGKIILHVADACDTTGDV